MVEIRFRDSRVSGRVKMEEGKAEYSFRGENLWGKKLRKGVSKLLKILGVERMEFDFTRDEIVLGKGRGGLPTPKQVEEFYHTHRRRYSGEYHLVVEKGGETKSYILNRGL